VGVIRHSILQQRTPALLNGAFCSTCWTGDNKRQQRRERRTWAESVAEFFEIAMDAHPIVIIECDLNLREMNASKKAPLEAGLKD
jgi:hypothetical protein